MLVLSVIFDPMPWVSFQEENKNNLRSILLELDKPGWKLSVIYWSPIKDIYSIIHMADCSSSQSFGRSLVFALWSHAGRMKVFVSIYTHNDIPVSEQPFDECAADGLYK